MLEFREGQGKSKHTHNLMSFLQPSPVCAFEVSSAGTSVVLVLQVTSLCWPISSSFSPAESSSEDSLREDTGKNTSLNTWIPKVNVAFAWKTRGRNQTLHESEGENCGYTHNTPLNSLSTLKFLLCFHLIFRPCKHPSDTKESLYFWWIKLKLK